MYVCNNIHFYYFGAEGRFGKLITKVDPFGLFGE